MWILSKLFSFVPQFTVVGLIGLSKIVLMNEYLCVWWFVLYLCVTLWLIGNLDSYNNLRVLLLHPPQLQPPQWTLQELSEYINIWTGEWAQCFHPQDMFEHQWLPVYPLNGKVTVFISESHQVEIESKKANIHWHHYSVSSKTGEESFHTLSDIILQHCQKIAASRKKHYMVIFKMSSVK